MKPKVCSSCRYIVEMTTQRCPLCGSSCFQSYDKPLVWTDEQWRSWDEGEGRIGRLLAGEFTPERIHRLNDELFRDHKERTGGKDHPFVQRLGRLTDEELKLCIRACASLESHPHFFGYDSANMLFFVPKLIDRVGCGGIQEVASIIGQTRNMDRQRLISIAPDVIARIGISGFERVARMATKFGWLGNKESEYGASYDFAQLFLRWLLPILDMEDENRLERWGRVIERLYVAHPFRGIMHDLNISEMGERIGLSGIEKVADFLVAAALRHPFYGDDIVDEEWKTFVDADTSPVIIDQLENVYLLMAGLRRKIKGG